MKRNVKKREEKRNGKKKKRQGRLVLLTLTISFCVLTWGVVTAYDNTRALGFGDTSGMVSVFQAGNGRRFVQIGQNQVDVDAVGSGIAEKIRAFLDALEEFATQLF